MPVYEFRCPECKTPYQSRRAFGDTHPPTCPTCDIPTRRRYSQIAMKVSLGAHYNTSIGAYVNNEREFKDQLKIQSEMATLRTGLEHNFVPHDPREAKEELHVTEEGLEATYRRRRELGWETGEDIKKLTTGKARADLREDPQHDEDGDAVVEALEHVEQVQWLP